MQIINLPFPFNLVSAHTLTQIADVNPFHDPTDPTDRIDRRIQNEALEPGRTQKEEDEGRAPVDGLASTLSGRGTERGG